MPDPRSETLKQGEITPEMEEEMSNGKGEYENE